MNQEQTLGPCAFCGKSHTPKIVLASEHWADEYDGYYPHSDSYAVMCDASSPNGPGGCGASGGFKATEADAIAAWNRRATQPAQPAQAAQSETCPTCGESEPYSGACGTSASDMRALCKRKAQAAQSEPVKPLFASKVASRKWSELQEAGARMQSIAFDGHKSGQPGTIDPWGVVRWGQAAQGAGEVVAWQHQKPIEGPTGEIEGYTDWMDGDGLPWWPRRALYTHPTPPPAQPAPVVPDGWKLVPIKCTEAMKDVGGQFEFATISDGRLLAQSMWNELLCATPTPPAQQPEAVPSEQSRWCVYVAGMVAGWLGMDVDDPKIPTMGAIIERRLWALKRGTPPAQAAADARDAGRYRLVRRGQHWSVINGIGDTLRGEDLDAAIDAQL